jgi:predicted dehydrogenase
VIFSAAGTSGASRTKRSHRGRDESLDSHAGALPFAEQDDLFDMSWATGESAFRVAIVGAGHRGVLVGKLLGRWPGFEIGLVVDTSRERARHLAASVGGKPVVADGLARRDLKKGKIAAVFVTSPDDVHAEHAIEAMKGGAHVFIEKPLATSLSQARRICAVSRGFDKVVHVGFVLRYAPFWRAIKQEMIAGSLGEIQYISVTEHLSVQHGASFMRRWHNAPGAAGLAVHKGCHDLDLLTWFIDTAPTHVSSFGSGEYFAGLEAPSANCSSCAHQHRCPYAYHLRPTALTPGEIADPAAYGLDRCVFGHSNGCVSVQTVSLQFPNRVLGSYELLMFRPNRSERFIRIVGTRGVLSGTFSQGEIQVDFSDGREAKSVLVAAERGHGGGDVRTVASFLRSIAGLEAEILTPDSALLSVAVAEAAERARLRNSVVRFNLRQRQGASTGELSPSLQPIV